MLKKATEYIEEIINKKYSPKIAVILGSGLGSFAEEIKSPIKIKYSEIPGFNPPQTEGHVGQLLIGKLNSKDILIMQGRLHYNEGLNMEQVVLPIKVMKKLGIEKLIITNAAGGINEYFSPGDLMFIKDHINFMGTNPLIGKNDSELGERFPDMSEVYNKELIEIAGKVASKIKLPVYTGVYLASTGPSYETPAEINMFRMFGADAVGMSTVPEAIVANYCGIKVLGISCISNMAAGVSKQKLTHAEVLDTTKTAKDHFNNLVKGIIKEI